MKKKHKLGRMLKSVILIALAVYVVNTFISQEINISQSHVKIKDIDSKIREQEIINNKLKSTAKMVGTPEYMEKLAREKLDMMKTDEILFIDVTTIK